MSPGSEPGLVLRVIGAPRREGALGDDRRVCLSQPKTANAIRAI